MAERAPADGWLVEQGIGEERALLYRAGHAVATQIRWPGGLEPGLVADAILTERARGAARGVARFADGSEALVSQLPREASEGAPLRLRITRAAMGETGRTKRAQARPCDEVERHALATSGIAVFPGGALHFAPTPAMTVVDVDGHLPPRELALAAVPVLARKTDRKLLDTALDQAMTDIDHERTAMNGFGLVQIVRRSQRPSLLHLVQLDPPGAAARLLLRQAERLDGHGAIAIDAHPDIAARLTGDWLAELRRRTGRAVMLRPDPALAPGAGHAQIVAP
ncbi:MAG: ribonuclease [Pelagerythrobacter marensis]|nr:MAG: ribonuclease [Pelagerythrobacter marensis]